MESSLKGDTNTVVTSGLLTGFFHIRCTAPRGKALARACGSCSDLLTQPGIREEDSLQQAFVWFNISQPQCITSRPPRINHPSRQLSSCGRMCAFVAIMRFNAFRLVLLLCGRRVWRVTCFLHQQLSRGCMSEGFCKKPFVCRRVRDQTVTRTSLKMFGFAFHQKENWDSSPAPRLWFISHHSQPISSFLTHHLHLRFSPCWFKSKLHSLNLCHDVRRGCWASFCCLLARLWFCFPFQHQTCRISSIQRSKAAGIALQPTNTPRQELESASGVNLQLAVTSCFQENSVNLRFQAEQLEDPNMIPFDQSPRWFVPWSVTHCDPAAHRGYIAQPRALKGRRGWDRNTIL